MLETGTNTFSTLLLFSNYSFRLFVPPLAMRRAKKKEGGVFRGWSVVVLLEDRRQKEVYRRMLELGGASVHRWTLTHLLDSQANASPQFKGLTHVVAQPGMLLQEHLRHFLAKNDLGPGGPSVVTHIYLGDFLTRKEAPLVRMYDVRNPEMWPLTEETWMVGQLQGAGIGGWKPPSQCQGVPWHRAALRDLELQEREENVEANERSPDYSYGDDDVFLPLETPADNPDSEEESGRWKTIAENINQEEEEEVMVLGVTKATSLRKPPLSAIARLKAKAAELEKKEKQNEPDYIDID